MQTVWKYFVSLVLSYKVRKKTAVLRCTANQVGTGHKLHFQPKHPARAKLAAINNKNGCGTAEVLCRNFRSVSYHCNYHIRSGKRQCCSVIPPTKSAQVISSIFSPKIQLGPNWQQSTTKMAVAGIRCDGDSSGSASYNWYYQIRSGKRQLCSVVMPTKSAQVISSIFSPKIQLGPNWQQSTTKMAVVRLRCNVDIFGSISYNWY